MSAIQQQHKCLSCDDNIPFKFYLCLFCYYRRLKIKKLKQKITNLEWELHLMDVQADDEIEI